ncbi:MAG: divergent polysaccharide deacetylase family protein, partial [Desulfuromonadales bacterium]|nr:divergent polysaccharide deacetylase family protein [Desulfuromonadales bacterium]
RLGVPAAVRDLFLDNVPEVDKIAAEIRRLVRQAKRQGQAVGICHPYPQTLEALRREAPALKREGVEVVPVSRLLVR